MTQSTNNRRGTSMRRFSELLLWSAVALVIGCGEREALPTDPQATVSGTVTSNGAPITTESSVVFFCKEKNAIAAGKIDSLGKFVLSPGARSIGIPAGRYQVMVQPPELPAPALGTKEYEDFMSGKVKRPDRPKEIPSRFDAFETSGLIVEVKTGENKFDFDLAKLKPPSAD